MLIMLKRMMPKDSQNLSNSMPKLSLRHALSPRCSNAMRHRSRPYSELLCSSAGQKSKLLWTLHLEKSSEFKRIPSALDEFDDPNTLVIIAKNANFPL